MATSAMEGSGLGFEELLFRITESEQLSILFAMAVEAAQRSHLEAKARALGRAVASGALLGDDAALDEAQLVTATLAALEVPHIRALLSLSEAGAAPDKAAATLIKEDLQTDTGAAQAILAVLTHQGLIWLDPPGFGGWGLTEYAAKLLTLLKDDSDTNVRQFRHRS